MLVKLTRNKEAAEWTYFGGGSCMSSMMKAIIVFVDEAEVVGDAAGADHHSTKRIKSAYDSEWH